MKLRRSLYARPVIVRGAMHHGCVCWRQRRRGGSGGVVADVAKLSVGREEYYTHELATDHEQYLVGCQKSPCHAAHSYSWISPPRTSRRRSRRKAGTLAASPPTDGMGVPWPRLRCGRRWL